MWLKRGRDVTLFLTKAIDLLSIHVSSAADRCRGRQQRCKKRGKMGTEGAPLEIQLLHAQLPIIIDSSESHGLSVISTCSQFKSLIFFLQIPVPLPSEKMLIAPRFIRGWRMERGDLLCSVPFVTSPLSWGSEGPPWKAQSCPKWEASLSLDRMTQPI